VARAVSIFRFYGIMGYRLKGEFTPSADPNTYLLTVREPLGVVAIITPWNFPIAIPSWKIAPALVCGNTVVFKPASYTPLIAYRLVDSLIRAGLPPGVLNLVTGPGSTVSDELINNPKVDAISFTGSLEVGEEIKRAVCLRNVRVQLELGGKNPAIVLDDADMDKAVEMVVRGAFGLAGQACTATSRAIVLESVANQFERKLVERVKQIKVGNGLAEGVEMGQ
jgi:aldehyde dehydrogenase (NAD+)